MTCFHPVDAWDTPNGIEFHAPLDANPAVYRNFKVPCGRCSGCLASRARDWSLRCVLEAREYEKNCFVTLTYSPDNLPEHGSLEVRDLQLFMKRLRKKYSTIKIRYFACGEYGSKGGRPHYHLLLFNFDFPDKWMWHSSGGSGNVLYRSSELEKLWPFGHSVVGQLTVQSAAYVARYCYKKFYGGDADERLRHYGNRVPEFVVMSRKPGIGYNFYKKYWKDFYPKDFFHYDGQVFKPCRYFDKQLKKDNEQMYVELKKERIKNALEHFGDNTPLRMASRESFLEERQKRLIRVFEDEA